MCGTCKEDWSSLDTRKESKAGGKTKQTKHAEDECAAYRAWRLNFGRPFYATDVDQIEWRSIRGTMKPVAVLELTRIPGNMRVPPTYFQAIQKRYFKRDKQSMTALDIGSRLGCPSYIVAFRWDLTDFWVYDLNRNNGKWIHGDKEAYEAFLKIQVEERYHRFAIKNEEEKQALGGALYRLHKLHARLQRTSVIVSDIRESFSSSNNKKKILSALKLAEEACDVSIIMDGYDG